MNLGLVSYTCSSRFQYTGTSSQSPQLLVDPNRAQPTAGESVNLTCYIVGETNSTDVRIGWMKDEETIATTNGSNKLVLQLETSDSSHTGVYTCEVVMDGMTLQANANVAVTCKYFSFQYHCDICRLKQWIQDTSQVFLRV